MDLTKRVEKNVAKLSEHVTQLEVTKVRVDTLEGGLADIKKSIRSVHTRIDSNSKTLNGKLDRLLERQQQG